MQKPVCVRCQRFFKPSRTGRYWTEMKPKNGDASALRGTEAPDEWEFYKVWSGDEYTCSGCGTTIIIGHGQNPITQDYQPDHREVQKSFRADEVIVNDC